MDLQETLTVAALVAIATAAGGAAVRLGRLIDEPGVVATVLVVVALLLAVVLGTLRSQRSPSTPYW